MTVPQEWTAAAARWGPLAVIGAVSLSFVAFVLRSAIRGARPSARVEKAGGTVLLSKYVMEYGLWVFGPVTRTAIRLEVHPDALTWASLLIQLASGAVLAGGAFGLGGLLLALGALCDAADGAVARARGLASDAGEVLDAAVDRWAEMAVFFGLAWYYRPLWPGFLLAAGACAGAVMVSYTRAKAEAFGIRVTSGLMQRHERAAWLSVAMVLSSIWEAWRPDPGAGLALHVPVLGVLGLVALLGNGTAWVRIRLMREELRRRERRVG
jgi:CDP-diacylglycerol--glycerol-3-phosphate 3-phosphatidyltransferase